eukprot:scpid20527/ scgid10984/ 
MAVVHWPVQKKSDCSETSSGPLSIDSAGGGATAAGAVLVEVTAAVSFRLRAEVRWGDAGAAAAAAAVADATNWSCGKVNLLAGVEVPRDLVHGGENRISGPGLDAEDTLDFLVAEVTPHSADFVALVLGGVNWNVGLISSLTEDDAVMPSAEAADGVTGAGAMLAEVGKERRGERRSDAVGDVATGR